MLYLLWIVCLFLGPVISSNRGNSGVAGFIWALLLGPIGVVIVLVIPKNHSKIETNQLRTGGMRKCPLCAELVKPEAVKCRHCGSDISEDRNAADPHADTPGQRSDTTKQGWWPD